MNGNNIENITNKIIVEFGKTIEMFDLTPLEARLFAYLYLSDMPMTLDDMSNALGKSKTSMSTSIRSLAELNLVSRVWKKGVRKDLYKANGQLFKLFMGTYVNKWLDATKHQYEALKEIETLIKQKKIMDEVDPSLEELNINLEKIIDFHLQIESFFSEMK